MSGDAARSPHTVPQLTLSPDLTTPNSAAHGDLGRSCLPDGADALARTAWGAAPPPWAPGRREDISRIIETGAGEGPDWSLSEAGLFCDLNAQETDAITATVPMRTYAAGELLYAPPADA